MKMNRFETILLCSIFFSLLFFVPAAFGQNRELRVLSVDSSDKPLRNVRVTIINLVDKKSQNRQ
ncbi:MAG TPA: hypothetical protein VLL97_02320, partial [Acidobacteriota bacterium]|nr:hypothetical protein [Acidobacteriota bacterium]